MTQGPVQPRAAEEAPVKPEQRTYACEKCGGPARRGKSMSPAAAVGSVSGILLVLSPFFVFLAIIGVIGLLMTIIVAIATKNQMMVQCDDCGHNFTVPKPSAKDATKVALVAMLFLTVLLSGCTSTLHTSVADALEGKELQRVEIDCARIWGDVNDHGDTWGFRVFDRIGAANNNEFIVVIVSKTDTNMDPEAAQHISLAGELRELDDGETFISAKRVDSLPNGCRLKGE